MILCIETATSICSVALCDSEKVISIKESSEGKSHATLLTIFIRDLLVESGLSAGDLEAIAISKGPGSYTGLRIGVSVAKGLSYGSNVPLIAINTLESMCHGINSLRHTIPEIDESTILCPLIDARRMDVYYALFDSGCNVIKGTTSGTIDESFINNMHEGRKILFFGNGSSKCREIISSDTSLFYEGFELSAGFLRIPASRAMKNGSFEDVAYFEPFYLKDFVATIPRKNILGG